MILTDLMALIGKKVRIIFTNGEVLTGVLEYAETYSEQYGWRKAKHFYLGTKHFRSWQVKEAEVIE